MYNIKLTDGYYSGSYAKVGKVQGGIDIPTLPPTDDSKKALCYKYDYHDVTSTQLVEVPVINKETGEQTLDEFDNPIYTTEEQTVTQSVLGWFLDEDKYKLALDESLGVNKSNKISEIGQVCKDTIIAGVDITLSDGVTYHFSLTPEDQTNISALYMKAINGATHLPYHADGELCKLYSTEDVITIANSVQAYITYNTTLCNYINNYIRGVETQEELDTVVYLVSTLPEDMQTAFNEFIASLQD